MATRVLPSVFNVFKTFEEKVEKEREEPLQMGLSFRLALLNAGAAALDYFLMEVRGKRPFGG